MSEETESAFLVDFQQKRDNGNDYDFKDDLSDEDDAATPIDLDSEESDIEDEFGRKKTVKRR